MYFRQIKMDKEKEPFSATNTKRLDTSHICGMMMLSSRSIIAVSFVNRKIIYNQKENIQGQICCISVLFLCPYNQIHRRGKGQKAR